MKNINEMNAVELKALEAEIKARKEELKLTAKADKATAVADAIATVNSMIESKELALGMNVVVLYGSKNEEVVGKLVGVLSVDKKSLTVESTAFKSTKDGEEDTLKRRYIEKSRFVRVAD
jgi:hypothetical protein